MRKWLVWIALGVSPVAASATDLSPFIGTWKLIRSEGSVDCSPFLVLTSPKAGSLRSEPSQASQPMMFETTEINLGDRTSLTRSGARRWSRAIVEDRRLYQSETLRPFLSVTFRAERSLEVLSDDILEIGIDEWRAGKTSSLHCAYERGKVAPVRRQK